MLLTPPAVYKGVLSSESGSRERSETDLVKYEGIGRRLLTDRHGNVHWTPSSPAPASIRGPRALCKEVTRQWSDIYHSTNEKVKDKGSRSEGQQKRRRVTWGNQEDIEAGERGSGSESGLGSGSSRLSARHQ